MSNLTQKNQEVNIDPPVLLRCSECKKPTLEVTSGRIRNEADKEWYEPGPKDFKPIRCAACGGTATKGGLRIDALCRAATAEEGEWKEYDMIAGRSLDE